MLTVGVKNMGTLHEFGFSFWGYLLCKWLACVATFSISFVVISNHEQITETHYIHPFHLCMLALCHSPLHCGVFLKYRKWGMWWFSNHPFELFLHYWLYL